MSWEIQRDFIFRTEGQATRGENAIGLTDIGNGLIVINPVQSTRLIRIDVTRKGIWLLLYRDRRKCDARNLR